MHIPTSRTANQCPQLQPIAQKLPPLLNADFGLFIGYNCSSALTTNLKEPYAKRTDLESSIVG